MLKLKLEIIRYSIHISKKENEKYFCTCYQCIKCSY